MALHRRFRPVFKKYAPRGTARFAKPLQGPFSLVAKHPQKHKNRPESVGFLILIRAPKCTCYHCFPHQNHPKNGFMMRFAGKNSFLQVRSPRVLILPALLQYGYFSQVRGFPAHFLNDRNSTIYSHIRQQFP